MARYKINCQLNVVLSNIEIEAESEEEALNKLYRKDCKDIIDYGYVEDSDIQDEEIECLDADYSIHITSVDYDVTRDEAYENIIEANPDLKNSDNLDSLIDKEIDRIADELPQELDLEVKACAREDLEFVIADMISDQTGYCISHYTYEIKEIR